MTCIITGSIINNFIIMRDAVQTYNGAISAISAIIVAIFTYKLFGVGSKQAELTKQIINLTDKEFISTHRPRIRVRNVVIKRLKDGTPSLFFLCNQPIRGQFYIANTGSSNASIIGIGCWAHIGTDISPNGSDILPMARPYEGKLPNISLNNTLKAGESIPVPFDSGDVVPNTEAIANSLNTGTGSSVSGTPKLYIMGFIEYKDDAETFRRTNFCRGWTGSRFVKVNNEDYENEE